MNKILRICFSFVLMLLAVSANAVNTASMTVDDVIPLLDKYQEEIFAKNNAVATPVVIETDGVKMTTVPTTFMDALLDVNYNIYEEGELDWMNGTKLVFTAKDKITGIVIVGNGVKYASADKGDYVNGVWTGTLEAGEVLTLTAGDGIKVTSIVVLYNGAKYTEPQSDEQKLNLNLQITKTDWATIGNQNGEVIGNVSCEAEVFDHYEFRITCEEDSENLITLTDLTIKSGNICCYTWERGTYDLYNGYNYTLTVSVFDVPYFGATPIATTTYKFVGTGKEPKVFNKDLAPEGLSLTPNSLVYNGYVASGNTFDITFNAPVSKINAWAALGFDGSQHLSAVKKSDDGTVWTVSLNDDLLNQEGSINVMIQAWDADGVPAKGWNGDNAFDYNIIISLANAIHGLDADASAEDVHDLRGLRVNDIQKGKIYIVNGKKVMK